MQNSPKEVQEAWAKFEKFNPEFVPISREIKKSIEQLNAINIPNVNSAMVTVTHNQNDIEQKLNENDYNNVIIRNLAIFSAILSIFNLIVSIAK